MLIAPTIPTEPALRPPFETKFLAGKALTHAKSFIRFTARRIFVRNSKELAMLVTLKKLFQASVLAA